MIILGMTFVAACGGQMADQPRYDPLEPSVNLALGMASRPLPAHTVPRGFLLEDESLRTGRLSSGADFVDEFPEEISLEDLERGRELYNIYCSPCHGLSGYGNGMVAQRGFPPPPSYHADRLRQMPVGYIYNVIGNGFGTMFSYAASLSTEDRWKVAGYVRALQLSQFARLTDIPDSERNRFHDDDEPGSDH